MTRYIKKSKAMTAIILTFLMVFLLPTQVFAQTLPEKEHQRSSFDSVQGEKEEFGNIVSELKDKRTENTKSFLLDDGTKMIAEYGTPVHFKDKKGGWAEYDNSLVLSNAKATPDEVSVGEYSNKKSNINVKFSNKAKESNMISVISENYSVSWGYSDSNRSNASVVSDNSKLEGNNKFTSLKNLTSEVKYENVYKDVDLQYFVTSAGVKENIILKSAGAQNEFSLTYKVNNLTAKQADDHSILLSDNNGKELYTISAPYMYDASGDTSTQLKLEIINQKGANLNIRLTADYWFIHSIGRKFPVTIDPEVTKKLSSQLSLYSVTGGAAASHGPYVNAKGKMTVFKVNSLPELEYGEQIINAKFNFEASNGETLFANESDEPIIINAHKLSALSVPSFKYETNVLDYDSLTYNDNHCVTFDLTKTFKDWYDNGDAVDGFVLEAIDTIGSKQVVFKEASKTSVTPSLTLIYKDFTGTEGNLSYHTISAGCSAQASVSDYLGNLVINQTLYEGTGSRMPVTLSAAYNSINYDKAFENGSPSGYGWQFSFNQSVREVTDENLIKCGYNYVFTDSDGTDHYLKKSSDSEEWLDEDGLGITLTKDGSSVYIDSGSIVQTYELPSNGGKLLSEKDEHNNTISYAYTDGNLTSITDGSGRIITILYYTKPDAAKRVNYIKLPDNGRITFKYTANETDKISYIEFPDKRISLFTYDSTGRLNSICQAYNVPPYSYGVKYTFSYDNGRVTKITENGSDGTEGNCLDIQYNNDNTTVFTDRRGRSETHTFDNSGATVSVLNANGYLQNSGSSGLSVSGGSYSYTKNYITESTEQSEIKSGGYYFKVNGGTSTVVSGGGTAVTDTSAPSEEDGYYQYFGTTSIKVNNPKTDSNAAFFTGAAHQFNDTSFNGKTVTFSAYVKTKNINQIYSGGAIGATLKIKCFDSNNTAVKEVNSIGVSGTADWQRISISAEIPENTSCFRVYCNLRYASGTAWFDCLQLEEGECANDFNALQNSDFSNNESWLTNEDKAISAQNGTVTLGGTAGAYDDFDINASSADGDESEAEETQSATYYETVTETVPNDRITSYDDYGNVIRTEQGFVTRTVKKTYEVKTAEPTESTEEETTSVGEPDVPDEEPNGDKNLGNKYIYQNVKVGRAGVAFNLCGGAQAKSVPLSNENRTFGIALNIYYEGETAPETHYQQFSADSPRKQSVCLSVFPEEENKVIDYVAFAFVYSYNKNIMTVYDAMLNISSENTGMAKEDSGDTAEDDNNAETNVDEDNYIDYEVVSESVDKTKTYMETSSAYDEAGNYAVSETDESGNTVSYVYDVNGNVTSVTDGEENVVNYTYNSSGNITSVKSGDAQNVYNYSDTGTLSSINHNSFSYKFNYSVFNQLISTKIGSVAFASNTYSANNGNLIKTTYANGDFIEYQYDEYDNIVKITGENGTLAEFIYNKRGLVSETVDTASGEITYYYYDFSGCLANKYCQSENGDLVYYVGADSDGGTVEKYSVNGQEKTIKSKYDDDNEISIENDGIAVSKNIDKFGRTVSVETSRGEGQSVFFTEYEYASGRAENSTTNLVSKLTQKYGADELVNYEYTYDGSGNVTEVYENGILSHKYSYDYLNQLRNEYDYINKFFVSYSYDTNGNVHAMNRQYLDQYNQPSGNPSGYVYYYDDSNWKDKLTRISAESITYDAQGNPLSYRDGMTMAWENGRQLKSIALSDKNTVNYKYNTDGIRAEKTFNGNIVKYYYDSNYNLIGMKNGNDVLYFYYDEAGKVTSMSYNGTMYYYIKNLQDDVVKIIGRDGTVYASYVYDAWGNVLSEKGDPIIRRINPFRYRGYVYDSETGLYYLQSRYYDPVIGRFINADVYCDTQSGSPLSTNMFAYCENNAVFYVDPTGYWNTSDHKTMTNDQGFSSKTYENVRNWAYNADTKGFASTNEYSAPFHGRAEALDIGKCLYNLAMKVKKNKKKYKFSESSQHGYYKLPNELKYKPQNKNKNEHKRAATNATANFIRTLNNAKNYTVQWQILLGLALHTFQDYSAHVIKVQLTSSKDEYYPSIRANNVYHYDNGKAGTCIMIYRVDDIMGLSNSAIEDNKNVLKWRYTFAKEITKTIYNNWKANREFDKFYTTQGKAYKDGYIYRRTTGFLWWKTYWYISSLKYYYHYTLK